MKEFDINAFDFEYLLLEYAKELKISEEEVIILLMINHILKGEPRSLVTPDLLAMKLSYPLEKIDVVLTRLNNRSLVNQVKVNKSMYTSLKPLQLALRDRVLGNLLAAEKIGSDEDATNALENIHSIFEREMGRPLSPIEMNQIHLWVQKYEKSEVLDAVYETKEIRKTKITIKSVEKTLFDRAVKKDRKSEGRTSLSENNDMSLKEAAEAAKLDWLND